MVTEKTVLRLMQIAARIWERNNDKMSTNGYYIRTGHRQHELLLTYSKLDSLLSIIVF